MPAEIAVGSNVLLATTNLHLKIVGTRKLIPRWVGPFKVTTRVGGMSYRLDLPACTAGIISLLTHICICVVLNILVHAQLTYGHQSPCH